MKLYSLCAWLLLGYTQQVAALGSEELRARTLAGACAACHGTDGRPVVGSTVAPLAGMAEQQFHAHMKGFRDGTRQATVMHQIARGISDEQVQTLARYFAQIKP